MEESAGDERGYPHPPEAEIVDTEHGKRPAGEGWYVLNATEGVWDILPGWGRSINFEPDEPRFAEFGLNIHVFDPGGPNCRYHAESNQEDFLVVYGECLLIAENEERRLRTWDFVHCPPWTRHVFVGLEDTPCAIVMVGRRDPDEKLDYPVDDEAAVRHGAAAPKRTGDAREAYADLDPVQRGPYKPGDLPGA
jgi:uncharacterized cupin superfamily protein